MKKFYVMKDAAISGWANYKFSPQAVETDRDICLGSDGKLYFEDTLDQTERRRKRIDEIDAELARLDAEYLPPFVLANLATGDKFALNRYEKHTEAVKPLRKERAALAAQKESGK